MLIGDDDKKEVFWSLDTGEASSRSPFPLETEEHFFHGSWLDINFQDEEGRYYGDLMTLDRPAHAFPSSLANTYTRDARSVHARHFLEEHEYRSVDLNEDNRIVFETVESPPLSTGGAIEMMPLQLIGPLGFWKRDERADNHQLFLDEDRAVIAMLPAEDVARLLREVEGIDSKHQLLAVASWESGLRTHCVKLEDNYSHYSLLEGASRSALIRGLPEEESWRYFLGTTDWFETGWSEEMINFGFSTYFEYLTNQRIEFSYRPLRAEEKD